MATTTKENKMATTTKNKFTHMVCSAYRTDTESNECAQLFTSLSAANQFIADQLQTDIDNGEVDDEIYFVAKIISSSKVARSIVTEDHKK